MYEELPTLREIKEKLDEGQYIFFEIEKFRSFIKKETEDKFNILLQPKYGSAFGVASSAEGIERIVSKMLLRDVIFFISSEVEIKERKNTLIDKIVDFFRFKKKIFK